MQPFPKNWSSIDKSDPQLVDLVGWWPLQEGGGLIAHPVEGFGSQGNFTNMVVGDWDRADGRMGAVLDGSSERIEVPGWSMANYCNVFGPWSVSMWIKPNAPGNDILFSDDAKIGIIYKSAGTLDMQNSHFSASLDNGQFTHTLDSEWHHLLLVQPGGSTSAYDALLWIDGVKFTAADAGGGSNPSNDYLVIGGRSGSATWAGQIADFRFYRSDAHALINDLIYEPWRPLYPRKTIFAAGAAPAPGPSLLTLLGVG